jgi:prepilin-type N-terminal cleavage/methylation domain-containing protein
MLTVSRTPRARRGFSLIEMLIAMTVLGVVAAGLTRLIVAQTQFYDTVSNQNSARSISRNAMNILLSDLRMVQDTSGIDSASTDGKTIRVKVPYRFGLVCRVTGTQVTHSMLPTDSVTLALATFAGFAWRNAAGVYTYHTGGAAPVLSGSTDDCTGSGVNQAQISTVSVAGRTGGIFDATGTGVGAVAGNPIFWYQRIIYSFAASSAFPGKIGLWRIVENGRSDELMAPFDTSARFRFYTEGAEASVVTPPALNLIRGLDLVLNSNSPRASSQSSTVAKSQMTTAVFFKNTRAF